VVLVETGSSALEIGQNADILRNWISAILYPMLWLAMLSRAVRVNYRFEFRGQVLTVFGFCGQNLAYFGFRGHCHLLLPGVQLLSSSKQSTTIVNTKHARDS